MSTPIYTQAQNAKSLVYLGRREYSAGVSILQALLLATPKHTLVVLHFVRPKRGGNRGSETPLGILTEQAFFCSYTEVDANIPRGYP